MAVNREVVENVVTRLMEQIEERFGEDQSAEIRSVFLIVAVDHLEGGVLSTEVSWGVSEGMPHHEGIGLIEYIKPQLNR